MFYGSQGVEQIVLAKRKVTDRVRVRLRLRLRLRLRANPTATP